MSPGPISDSYGGPMDRQPKTPPIEADLPSHSPKRELGHEEALRGILAALTQNKTYPADIEYARNIARWAIRGDGRGKGGVR